MAPIKKRPFIAIKGKGNADVVKRRNIRIIGSAGLPKTVVAAPINELVVRTTNDKDDGGGDDVDEEEFKDEFNAACIEHIPSDAILAIQELIRSQEGLSIPLTTRGGMIVGVLECQIQELFLKNGSSRNLSEELDAALQSNLLRKLSSSSPGNPDVYLTASDYSLGVRDAVAEVELCESYLQSLQALNKCVISRQSLERSLKGSSLSSNTNCAEKIRHLQDKRVLLSIPPNHDSFKLFLPTWGDTVLPAFRKLQSDCVVFLKQSKHKERSLVSVIRRFNKSPIPIARSLLPWMVAQGQVTRFERPSGPFIRLVEK